MAQLDPLGAFAQDPPAPSEGDLEQMAREQFAVTAPVPSDLPPEPVIYGDSGPSLLPAHRVDGATEPPPWGKAEPLLWDELRDAPIEILDELIFNSATGVFAGKLRLSNEQLSPILLRFDGLGRNQLYDLWSEQFALDPDRFDLIKRELVAYEFSKCLGMEDLVPPMALRRADLGDLLSGYLKEKIASLLLIGPEEVPVMAGKIAICQFLVRNSDSFLERWSSIGSSVAERFVAASGALRHSIYRAMALDFLLWTVDRPLASLVYNADLDRIAVYDLPLSFDDPSKTAAQYIENRSRGWGRAERLRLESEPIRTAAHGMDCFHLMQTAPTEARAECLQTFVQVASSIDKEKMTLLGAIATEQGLPPVLMAGFCARLAFLQSRPDAVLQDPLEFVKTVSVPMVRGYGVGISQDIVELADQLLAQAIPGQSSIADLFQQVPGEAA